MINSTLQNYSHQSTNYIPLDKVDCFVLESQGKLVGWLEQTSRGERDEENPTITLLQKVVKYQGILVLAKHFGPFVWLYLPEECKKKRTKMRRTRETVANFTNLECLQCVVINSIKTRVSCPSSLLLSLSHHTPTHTVKSVHHCYHLMLLLLLSKTKFVILEQHLQLHSQYQFQSSVNSIKSFTKETTLFSLAEKKGERIEQTIQATNSHITLVLCSEASNPNTNTPGLYCANFLRCCLCLSFASLWQLTLKTNSQQKFRSCFCSSRQTHVSMVSSLARAPLTFMCKAGKRHAILRLRTIFVPNVEQ